MKKINIVSPSFAGGGAERVAINLSNYYANLGLEVVLIVFSSSGPYKDQVDSLVKVVCLETRNRYAFFKLFCFFRVEKPEKVISVIRSSNIVLGFLSYFLKFDLTVREANTMDAVNSMKLWKRFFYKILMRFSYRKANIIIANSRDTKNDLLTNKIVRKDKVCVVGNPVLPSNLEGLVNEKCDHKWSNSDSFDLVLNVGRLHHQKNQALLLESFSFLHKNNQRARLIILGEGDLKSSLTSKARSLGIDEVVDFVPFQKNPFPFYKASKVFVLTSSWEGFGNVLVEAMYCHARVVSIDCPGGPKSILEGGKFGCLLQTSDPESISCEIEKAIEDNDITTLESAYKRSLEYTVPYIASLYYELATGHKLP